jgi:hypothetical protein
VVLPPRLQAVSERTVIAVSAMEVWVIRMAIPLIDKVRECAGVVTYGPAQAQRSAGQVSALR